MSKIDSSEESFKTSPLGFLMATIAKFNAFADRSLSGKPDAELEAKNEKAKDVLSNIKIELAKNDSLKNEPSNEAVMMGVMEALPVDEQETVLDTIFEYHGILDEVLQSADKSSENGRALISEYYDVSRLGLILNCYLGQFDNDDFFYGTLAHVMETVGTYYSENKTDCDSTENPELSEKIPAFCTSLISRIEKADINLAFDSFLTESYASLDEKTKKIFYDNIIRPYADSLLEKIITQEPDESDGGRLACVKQIQRKIEKLWSAD